MSDYDSFAHFYDLAMGDRREVALALRRLIRHHAPKAKTLLELGCGSGSLLKVLSRSYICSGIDISQEMIRIAKRKVPKATFKVGDIADFHFNEHFDVILCAFDTINHLLEFKQWEKLFQLAKEYLNPNGILIFDVNTQNKIERYHSEPPFAKFRNDAITIFSVKKIRKSLCKIELQIFKKRGNRNYQLKKIVIHEAIFPTPKIVAALKKHFSVISLVDFERSRATEKTEELYFVCKRPKIT